MGEYISRIEVGGNTLNAMIHLPTQTLRNIVLQLAASLVTSCIEPANTLRGSLGGNSEIALAEVAEFLYSIVAVSLIDCPLEAIYREVEDVRLVTVALAHYEQFKTRGHLYPFMQKDFSGLNAQLLAPWEATATS